MLDGLRAARHDAGLVALSGEQDVAGAGQMQFAEGQVGDFYDAGAVSPRGISSIRF